jgi:hypothetical protein
MKVHNHSLSDDVLKGKKKGGRKTLYIKMKDKNPSNKITRQKKAQVDTTQRKKMKVNNQQKIRKKKPYANMTQSYEMIINDNK